MKSKETSGRPANVSTLFRELLTFRRVTPTFRLVFLRVVFRGRRGIFPSSYVFKTVASYFCCGESHRSPAVRILLMNFMLFRLILVSPEDALGISVKRRGNGRDTATCSRPGRSPWDRSLLVAFSHYAERMKGTSWDAVVFKIAESGWAGVDLFLALSGFLITGILIDARGSPRFLRNFFARRILRIFPLYYVALVVYYCFLQPIEEPGTPAASPIWFFAYGSNILAAIYGWPSRFVGHFWSLAVEEQFYLLWPLLVLWLPARRLLIACMSLWFCAAACGSGPAHCSE